MRSAPALATAFIVAHIPFEGLSEIHEDADVEVVEHEEEGRNVTFVGKLVGGFNRTREATLGLVGPGFDVEVELWPHGLELELAGAALFNEDVTCVPVELLLKKAFHFGHVEVFGGLGGLANFVHAGEHGWSVHPGGVGLMGAILWDDAEHFGLLTEVAYGMCVEDSHVAHELEAGVGVAFRL